MVVKELVRKEAPATIIATGPRHAQHFGRKAGGVGQSLPRSSFLTGRCHQQGRRLGAVGEGWQGAVGVAADAAATVGRASATGQGATQGAAPPREQQNNDDIDGRDEPGDRARRSQIAVEVGVDGNLNAVAEHLRAAGLPLNVGQRRVARDRQHEAFGAPFAPQERQDGEQCPRDGEHGQQAVVDDDDAAERALRRYREALEPREDVEPDDPREGGQEGDGGGAETRLAVVAGEVALPATRPREVKGRKADGEAEHAQHLEVAVQALRARDLARADPLDEGRRNDGASHKQGHAGDMGAHAELFQREAAPPSAVADVRRASAPWRVGGGAEVDHHGIPGDPGPDGEGEQGQRRHEPEPAAPTAPRAEEAGGRGRTAIPWMAMVVPVAFMAVEQVRVTRIGRDRAQMTPRGGSRVGARDRLTADGMLGRDVRRRQGVRRAPDSRSGFGGRQPAERRRRRLDGRRQMDGKGLAIGAAVLMIGGTVIRVQAGGVGPI
ncbi:hypothetical protein CAUPRSCDRAFT_11781 [Caulochytrium protostelioides]|uniref:Uncharacterized protein n=1 Tax=Caulochytrium protostelioides TaxID=1555241 RepID=A0A4P9WYY4_9FUNG|nr:hypothetical protein CAUPRSCDRAFT_11781 [Caulochytrium protostelioides]